MNKLHTSFNSRPQNFTVSLYNDSGFKRSWKINRNRMEHRKHLSNIFGSFMQKTMRRKIKEFILGLIFLVAFCFAGVDSRDFTFFVLTKIVTVSLFALAYIESRGLWNRKERISDQERSGGEDSRELRIGVMRFFDRRTPKIYSVLFKQPLRKEQISMCGAVEFPKSK